ncbi:hypothetical protein PFISCL1PPCAC_9215 [Pristionchus fissidentatus]|uniref:Uncharacterized protein n=1 Tax=Pristionchus fissidentatus TaxID=1538716 RepID=A0AAV5VI75_9BILA|nr:hypothetical protein PFISCL1PPCAC_9215 [Pristionchus fissidentatus]
MTRGTSPVHERSCLFVWKRECWLERRLYDRVCLLPYSSPKGEEEKNWSIKLFTVAIILSFNCCLGTV